MEEVLTVLTSPGWWSKLLRIVLIFAVAFGLQRLSRPLAERLLSLNRLTRRKKPVRAERLNTLHGLTSSLITLLIFLFAIMLVLIELNVEPDTVVWVTGLFAAGFGLGARPLVSDFLTGVSLLFEDPYDVGEKVELADGVQGIIEAVNLRTTHLRAYTGELFTVPNGEVRVIRNFSRGRFSIVDVKINLAATDLERAVELLEALGEEALVRLPKLLEPWQVLSVTGELGTRAELTLVAKARFGQAAEMRPRLLTLVQKRLKEADIELL